MGKTPLVNRFVNDIYSEHGKGTIGAGFLAKEVVLDGRPVELRVRRHSLGGREKGSLLTD